MKNKLNTVWRLAIAALLVIGLSLTMVVPAAAQTEADSSVGADNVTGISILSPSSDSPVVLQPGQCFDLKFNITGNGVGAFGVLLGKVAVFTSEEVCFPISDATVKITVPPEMMNDHYDITLAAGTTGQSPLDMKQFAIQPDAVFVDGVAPEVILTNPADGAFVKGCIKLTAEAADEMSECVFFQTGVHFVQFAYKPVVEADAAAATVEDGYIKIDGPVGSAPYCMDWNTACVPDGDYYLMATAFDCVGNKAKSNVVCVTVDNTLPTVPAVITPNGGESWKNGSVYSIKWVQPQDDNFGPGPIDIDLYQVIDGKHVFASHIVDNFSAEVEGCYDWLVSGIQPDCNYEVAVIATDLAGNSNHDYSDHCFSIYTIDNSAPIVNIVSPEPGFISGTIGIEATAQDDQSGISRVEFAYSIDDGCNWIKLEALCSDVPNLYLSSLNTGCIADGAKVLISFTAYNAAGGWSTDIECYTADNSAPVVCLAQPEPGDIFSGNIGLVATASDAHSGIKDVQFAYTTKACPTPGDWTVIGSGVLDDCAYKLIWDTTGLADGAYYLQAKAINGVDMETYSNTVKVIIDRTAPDCLKLTAPNGGEIINIGSTYKVKWTTPTDANLGDKPIKLEIFKGGALEPSFCVSGLPAVGPYCWEVKNLVPGNDYWIRITATDLAGNSVLDDSDGCFSICGYDDTAPEVTLTAPADEACVKGLVTLSATACDVESGIKAVVFEFSLNNGESWNYIAEDCYAPYSVTWDTTGNNAAGVLVRATAENGVGLKCSDINYKITVDNTAPFVTINPVLCPENKFPIITGTAGDELSGVVAVKVAIQKGECLFWDGCKWVESEKAIWLDASGTSCWAFDARCIPFETDTLYRFFAKSIDCAGNVSEPECEEVFCETDKLCLNPGWNFISIPHKVIADYDTFDKLMKGVNYQEAYGYDPCVGWFPLVGCANPVKVETLSGYWVLAPGNCPAPSIIKMRYDCSGASAPAQKCLMGDAWNAIGPTGQKVGDVMPVVNELMSITNITGSWSTLVTWNSEKQCYEQAVVWPGMTGCMVTGQGYWIFISNPAGDTLCEYVVGADSLPEAEY